MSRLALITVAGIALAAELSRRGSRAMVDEGMVGNYWGSQGVGTLLTTGQEVFLTLRSAHVLDPEVWGLPGGAVRVDSSTGESDDLYFSASTELQEETGLTLSPEEIRSGTVATTVFRPPRSTFRFTTFVVRAPARVDLRRVRLNWENTDAGWFTPEDLLNLKLHPGVTFSLRQAWASIFDRSAPGFGLLNAL